VSPQNLNSGLCRAKLPGVAVVGAARGSINVIAYWPTTERGQGCCEGKPKVTQ
jgi:hypothetical protein